MSGPSVHNTVLPNNVAMSTMASCDLNYVVGGASMVVTQLENAARPQVTICFTLRLPRSTKDSQSIFSKKKLFDIFYNEVVLHKSGFITFF